MLLEVPGLCLGGSEAPERPGATGACGTDGCLRLWLSLQAVFSSVFYFASVPLYQGFLMVG